MLSSGQLAPHPPLERRYFSTVWSYKTLEKQSVSQLSYLFAHLHLLSSHFFSSLIFSLLFLSSLPLPTSAFPSVHIVGSLTSNLRSQSPRSLRSRTRSRSLLTLSLLFSSPLLSSLPYSTLLFAALLWRFPPTSSFLSVGSLTCKRLLKILAGGTWFCWGSTDRDLQQFDSAVFVAEKQNNVTQWQRFSLVSHVWQTPDLKVHLGAAWKRTVLSTFHSTSCLCCNI